MKTLLLSTFIFLSFLGIGQDYSNYYNLVNRAEEKFISLGDSSCFKLYDEAFKSNTPFIKDPYIASQIAFYLKDSVRFYHFMKWCFSLGMPITSVNAAPIFQKNLKQNDWLKINAIYSLNYKPKTVDSTLYSNICHYCYQSDSIKLVMGTDHKLNQQFYASENAARKYILESLLQKGVYANEHLVPISSAAETKAFYKAYNRPDPYAGFPMAVFTPENELRVMCPFNIILHSYCFFQQHRELFFEMVKKGYLHPKEFGIMEEISIMWYKKNDNYSEQCSQPEVRTSYNILTTDNSRTINLYTTTPEGLKLVEQNRKTIYMQQFSVDEQKKRLEKELGFAFFFDFIDRL